MDPRDTVSRIYKAEYNTLPHKSYESSGSCGFGEEVFFMFSPLLKAMQANDPLGGAILSPGA